MTVFKANNVSAALEKKGFERRSGNVNHCRYEFYGNGRPAGVTTCLSHTRQEITGDFLAWMAKEMYLSKEEFDGMITCKIGYDELVARYTARVFPGRE